MMFTLQVLLPAFSACLLFTLLLSYLGLHVLAREVIFVDIALAQLAALGTAVGAYLGVDPHDHRSLAWSLLFTLAGALVFSLTRTFRARVSQEAFIGITYAVAAALEILVANALPHGDEELQETLVGSLLTVEWGDVALIAGIFAVVGALHIVLRGRFAVIAHHEAQSGAEPRAMLWDFLFYATFAIVITASVRVAGVLLVFAFLTVPGVFSALCSRTLWVRLLIGWAVGLAASAAGLWASFQLDLPTGAAVVMALGVALVLGVIGYSLRATCAIRPG